MLDDILATKKIRIQRLVVMMLYSPIQVVDECVEIEIERIKIGLLTYVRFKDKLGQWPLQITRV